jgi:hypothetical protein
VPALLKRKRNIFLTGLRLWCICYSAKILPLCGFVGRIAHGFNRGLEEAYYYFNPGLKFGPIQFILRRFKLIGD